MYYMTFMAITHGNRPEQDRPNAHNHLTDLEGTEVICSFTNNAYQYAHAPKYDGAEEVLLTERIGQNPIQYHWKESMKPEILSVFRG